MLATLPLGGAALAAYIYVEARVAREPIIPLALLTARTTLAACLTNWFITMAVFGMLFYVPVYLQARGYSATAAGARLAANSAGVATGSLLVGTAIRALGRYWWLNVGVQATLVLGFALLAGTLDRGTAEWPPFVYLALVGTGYSGMLTVSLISLISAVEQASRPSSPAPATPSAAPAAPSALPSRPPSSRMCSRTRCGGGSAVGTMPRR